MIRFRKKFVLFIIISLLIVSGLFLSEMNSYSKTYGVFWINKKEIINNKYFISVGYFEPWIQLKCTKQVYTNVKVDKKVAYNMAFKTKVHDPYVGELIDLEMKNVYDNKE